MSMPPQAPPTCYNHHDRVAGAVCRRCGRPICPECMREAPVGWQCNSCVREGHKTSPVIRWRPRPAGGLGRTRVTPAVIVLIVINVVAYLWESNHGITNAFEAKYFIVPALVHSELYTLITSAFLHLNTTHILLNMVTLAIIGSPVEAEIGPVRFSMLYLLAALGGSVGFYLLAPANEAGAGASGAIFGLMGAYLVLSRLRGWEVQTIVALLVVNALYSLSPGIAWQDHLGGFVAGCVGCFSMMWRPSRSRPTSEVTEAVQALTASIAMLVAMGLLLQIPPGHVNL